MLVGRARTTLSPSDSHHPLSLSFEDPSPSTSMTLPPAPFDPNAPPTREHDLRSRTSRTSLGASKKYLEESVDTDTGDAELVPLLGQSAYDLAGGSVFDDPELAGCAHATHRGLFVQDTESLFYFSRQVLHPA